MDALIQLSGLSFSYTGSHADRLLVLNGIDLSIGAGERLALVGANGAGKSTLLRLMVGLLAPTAGTIVAFGQPRRREADFHEVRRRIGLVFQDADDQLFCPTVAEDVAFGPLNMGKSRAEATALVDAILARLEIAHLRDRITHHLSGGEKRMVSLASVLVMEPDLLLLDEPTTALDEPARAHLIDVLNALPQAMLLISHDGNFRRRVAPVERTLTEGRIV